MSPCLLVSLSVAARTAAARVARNCWPVLRAEYGFNQEGGELKPTAVRVRVICLIDRDSGKQSMMGRREENAEC